MANIDDEVLQDLYSWVDQIPLSRAKKNIARDFSDGVMMAELIKHFFPNIIELHNYPTCHAVGQKKKNWLMLNWRVFKRLGFELSEDVIDNITNSRPGTVERVLLLLRTKMDRSMYDRHRPDASGGGGTSPNNRSPRQQRKGGVAGGRSSRELAEGGPNAINYAMKDLNNPPPGLLESDFVSANVYDHKLQECLAKDETIDILQAKIKRLEHLIQLKDVRMEDLQARLQGFPVSGGQAPPDRISQQAPQRR